MSFLKLKLSFLGHFTLESRVNSMGILVIWYYEISNIERERERGCKSWKSYPFNLKYWECMYKNILLFSFLYFDTNVFFFFKYK